MVAVKSFEADRFLSRPPVHMFLYLVFGPDAGLVTERAKAIIGQAIEDPKDPFQLLRIDGDELAADPLRLADEANTIPLFGGRRAIWIEAQGKAFLNALEPVLAAPPRDCTIVIEAGALKKDAALRKLCERDKNAAAIECYPDGAREVLALIESEHRAAGLRIGSDAKSLLAGFLGQDRLTTRSELAKLILFAHGEGEVTEDHIGQIVSDASSLALDTAINGAFEGNFAAVEKTAKRVFAEAGDANMLLGAALRHAIILHRARLDQEAGMARQGAGGFAQAAGFKRAQVLERHVGAWTSERLARAINVLAEAVGKVRREPRLAEVTAVRALWSVALAARNKTAS